MEIIINIEAKTQAEKEAEQRERKANKPKLSLGKKVKREALRVVKQIERKLER